MAVFLFLHLVYAGCAIPTMQMQTKFDPTEHRPYLGVGNNNIKGQAFLAQHSGIVTCAGNDVLLVPATTFFREAITGLNGFRKPQTAEKIDAAFKPMIRRGQCDAQGNFSFQKVPDGAWFILADVNWAAGSNNFGSPLVRQFNIPQEGTTQVLLTEKDLPPYGCSMKTYESVLNSFFPP